MTFTIFAIAGILLVIILIWIAINKKRKDAVLSLFGLLIGLFLVYEYLFHERSTGYLIMGIFLALFGFISLIGEGGMDKLIDKMVDNRLVDFFALSKEERLLEKQVRANKMLKKKKKV